MSPLAQVLTTAFGALTGAGLAIPVGLHLDRRVHRRQRAELKRFFADSVFREMDRNRRELERFRASWSAGREAALTVPLVSDASWSGLEGHLDVLDPETAVNLATYYRTVRDIRTAVERHWPLLFGQIDSASALSAVREYMLDQADQALATARVQAPLLRKDAA